MDMIERVAIAIRHHKFARTGRLSVFNPELCTDNELGEARAAIEAMREPTNAMLAVDAPDMPAGGDVGEIWQSMIDAALNPSQT